ncbi:MAG: hypothetical protein ACUVUU_09680 [bacterium]
MPMTRFGLIGSPYSTSLCLIKRAAEDRGFQARFLSPLAFPRYALSKIGSTFICLDHINLLDFDCFYIDLLEHRDGFFRGDLEKKIWASLQQRYYDFEQEEVQNKAYQISFLLLLGDLRACMNSPDRLLFTRLRPTTFLFLKRSGIPVADFRIVSNQSPQIDSMRKTSLLRIRIEEERSYDVPCFPRELINCFSIEISMPQKTWEVVAIYGSAGRSVVEKEDGKRISKSQPHDVNEICQAALNTLGLDVASIELGRYGGELKIVDVNPFPDIGPFEEITQEPISDAIVDRMIERSEIK